MRHTKWFLLTSSLLMVLPLLGYWYAARANPSTASSTQTITPDFPPVPSEMQVDIAALDNENYTWDLPLGFPPPKVYGYNHMTEAKVELGRYLFYDTRVSGNGAASCSSCHIQALAFSDGRTKGIGATGESTPHNSMHLANAVYNGTFTWANPVLVTLEKQIVIPMFGEFPIELGMTGSEQEILERFRRDPFYADFFAHAYPEDNEPVSLDNMVQALASFVRSMISGNSAYDRFVYQGERDALSDSAKLGMNLFFSERLECHHCHGTFNFTQSLNHDNLAFAERPFHNTGLYNVDGEGAYPHPNTGLFAHTGEPSDMGKFRAPSLRNVAYTAPYFHDGSARTLDEVIDIYAAGGRLITEGDNAGDGRVSPHKDAFVQGFTLSDEERQGVIDFLHSLSDETFITDPRYSNPFTLPVD
jgi:cytochrome c peroxidase